MKRTIAAVAVVLLAVALVGLLPAADDPDTLAKVRADLSTRQPESAGCRSNGRRGDVEGGRAGGLAPGRHPANWDTLDKLIASLPAAFFAAADAGNQQIAIENTHLNKIAVCSGIVESFTSTRMLIVNGTGVVKGANVRILAAFVNNQG